MTIPSGGGGFEYTDDSVIARVSFDLPDQAATNIQQLSSAMGAMRTQVEAVTRAQSDWVDYLQQIPDIAEQANNALRSQITLLERMSYLQNEIGGRGNLSGSYGGVAGGGGAGAVGGYSTAAQPGAVATPWAAGIPGLGMDRGVPSESAVAQQIERISNESPELEAKMDSARGGRAINPATAATVGAALARRLGLGKPASGANKPKQPNNRRADEPPGDDGAPISSESQDTPGDANENEPEENKKTNLVNQVLNEFRGGKDGRGLRIAGMLMNAVGSRMLGGSGGGGGGGGGDADTNAITKFLGNRFGALGTIAGKVISSPAGQAAGALGLGAMAFNKVQDVGEDITKFQQLGSVQGGDFMTGMKYEAQARIMALNPFITTQQARQAMQMALKEGFRGDNYDTVQDFMIQNFKDLGISMGQSMELMKAQAVGLSESDSQSGLKKDLTETLNTMKELSAEGGASFPERANQLQELSQSLAGDGYSPESINRAAIGLQEGYGDSLALRESITGITSRANKDTMFKTMVAGKMGITGMLPGALGPALNRAGLDPDEVLQIGAESVAKMVAGHPDPLNRIANFQSLMNNVYGQDITFEQAEALLAPYDKGVGGGNVENPLTKANRKVSRQGETDTNSGRISSNAADSEWNKNHPAYRPSPNAAGVSGSFDDAGRGTANFAPSGNTPAPMPQSGSPIPVNVNSSGVVTGNLTVTIDQAGRATAPAVISLTGTQKAAFAGYGSSQLNNAPPGDPASNHSFNSFPQPGGGG